MEIATQIIAAIGGSIVGLGLLIFVLRHVFVRLEKKLDITVFEEYSKRVADNLESGKRRFDKIDEALMKNTDALNMLCKEFEGIKIYLKEVAKKLP